MYTRKNDLLKIGLLYLYKEMTYYCLMKSWKTLTNWYIDYKLVLLKSLLFFILVNPPLETPSCP